MTEQKILAMGFDKADEYTHDQFVTAVYKKGKILVDFTYEKGKLISTTAYFDIGVDELPVDEHKLALLDQAINTKA